MVVAELLEESLDLTTIAYLSWEQGLESLDCHIASVRSGTESSFPPPQLCMIRFSSSHVSLRCSENEAVFGTFIDVCGKVVIDVTFLGKAGITINRIPDSLATQSYSSTLRLVGQGWLSRTRAVQWLMDWLACVVLQDLDQRHYQVYG